ncbi:hypothetical protein A4X13_0g8754, partial [Tilletia indica]
MSSTSEAVAQSAAVVPANAAPDAPAPPKSRPSKSGAASGGKKECVWTVEEELAMLDVLEEDFKKGKAGDGGWKASTWMAVAAKVSALSKPDAAKAGPEKGLQECKNHFRNYMSNCWKELKQLFSLSGFGWDAEKGTVTAEKEAWDTLDTQKLKSLQKWKRKTCPWYERVDVFFSKSTATGSHARNFGAKAASKDNDDDEGDDEDTSSEEDDEKESGGDSGGSDDEDGAENKKDVKGKGKKREGAKSGTDNKRPRLSTSSKALTSIADGIHL